MEELDRKMKELRKEDITAFGGLVREMEQEPLRKVVQEQMEDVQRTIGQGYMQVMQ